MEYFMEYKIIIENLAHTINKYSNQIKIELASTVDI